MKPHALSTLGQQAPYGSHGNIRLPLQETCPHVQVATSAFASITAAAAQGVHTAKLQVTLAVSSSYKVTALIQAKDPLSGDELW